MKESKMIYRSTVVIGAMIVLLLTGVSCQSKSHVFGAPIDEKKGALVDMQKIFSHTDEYVGKNVIVQGATGQICLAAGCWLMLTDGSNQLFVQFYNFTARPPVRSAVRVQGVLKLQNRVPFIAAEGMEILR